MSFWVVFFLALGVALPSSVHILLHKQQPRSALLWLMWVWFFPFFGSAFYWYFGHNRVGRLRLIPRQPSQSSFKRVRGGGDPLQVLGDSVTGWGLRAGNKVRLLQDGHRAYPAMLLAIEGARDSVALQSYIFDHDKVGRHFLAALMKASRRGVRVRVLLDGVGAWGSERRVRKQLLSAGAECLSYWRLDKLFRQPLFNLRNHRKLLVVDGQTAFCGGLNISGRYSKGPLRLLQRLPLSKKPVTAVRDLHFGLQGPIVADLLAVFGRDWAKTSGGSAQAPDFKARPARAGSTLVRVVPSGPDADFEKGLQILMGGLRYARRQVDICTPYFMPDHTLLAELRRLSHAGVRVRVHVPRNSDHPFVHWAAHQYYGRLLEAGVEVWELRGSFVHSKAAVVDGKWCFVGSSNLDPRSFNLNFELDVEVYSAGLGRELQGVMQGYRHSAIRVNRDMLARQGLGERLRGGLINLLSPYL